MILAIDIGNTNAMFCIFKKLKIVKTFKLQINKLNTKKQLNEVLIIISLYSIKGIIISSVVPKKNKIFKSFFIENLNINPYFSDDLLPKFSIKTKIKNKQEIGSDRLVNVIYAIKITKPPILLIDFGTATTIDYINEDSVYEGGIISSGIDLSLKCLHEYTAKLPLVSFSKTKFIIGNSTKSAIRSGFFWGYISMMEGLIKRIKSEKKVNPKIILTGGNANFFKDYIKNIYLIDKNLTLKGLNFIYRKLI